MTLDSMRVALRGVLANRMRSAPHDAGHPHRDGGGHPPRRRRPGIVLSFGVSVLIGIFFGIYPAGRAAALTPMEALRYE